MKNGIADSTDSSISRATAMPPSQTLKSGAKRKFSIRDDDDQHAVVCEPGKQDFQFNRNIPALGMSDDGINKPILSRAIKAAGDKAPQVSIPSVSDKEGIDGKVAKDSKENAPGASAAVIGAGRKALGPSKCFMRSQIWEILTIIQRV